MAPESMFKTYAELILCLYHLIFQADQKAAAVNIKELFLIRTDNFHITRCGKEFCNRVYVIKP